MRINISLVHIKINYYQKSCACKLYICGTMVDKQVLGNNLKQKHAHNIKKEY